MTNTVLRAWDALSQLPLGARVFSRAACLRVPYFSSIRPHITTLAPGHCQVRMKERRRVTNHLGTVHAIAMCNLAEVAAGLTAQVTAPSSHRWIPRGMAVEYLKKAETDLRARCQSGPLPALAEHALDWPLQVQVFDTAGQMVFRAVITLWVSPKGNGHELPRTSVAG